MEASVPGFVPDDPTQAGPVMSSAVHDDRGDVDDEAMKDRVTKL
jgi:hypothetical protein